MTADPDSIPAPQRVQSMPSNILNMTTKKMTSLNLPDPCRDNFSSSYEKFIMAFHDGLECRILDHINKFNDPPTYQKRTFSAFDLFCIVRECGGIHKLQKLPRQWTNTLPNAQASPVPRNWTQVAAQLGYETKTTNISFRIKEWLRFHHIDSFFDYMMNISNPFFTKSENFSESHTESKLSPEYSNLNENMKMEEVSVVMTNHLPNPSIKMDESRIQSNQMPNPHKSVEEASMILANQLKNRKAEDATMVLASQLQSTTRNAEDVSMILANKFPNPHNNTEDSSIGKGNHLPNHISNEGLTKSPPTPMILKSINVNVPTTRSNSLIQYSLDSRLTEYAYDSNDSFARKRRNSESVNANRKKGFFSTDAKDGDNHIVDDSYQREQLINRLIKENQELANKCRRYEDHLGARDQRIQLLQKELEDKANQLHRASQFKEMLNRYRDLLPDGKMTTL